MIKFNKSLYGWSYLKYFAIIYSLYILFRPLLFRTILIVTFIDDPCFVVKGPYKTTTEDKINDTYDQLLEIKNFTFLSNPPVCEDNNGLLLLIIVSSKPDHVEARNIIRDTWGKAENSTKIVFLFGESPDIKLAEVQTEIAKYGDIVQGNFVDSYRNMTYKQLMGFKWAVHHCGSAKYILKTDDDIFVNIKVLRHVLVRELSPWGTKNLIAGDVLSNTVPMREKRYNVTVDEYSGDVYPDYCRGYAVIYSADVLPRLLSMAQTLPYFWIDDVFITGIVADKLGIERRHLTGHIFTLTLSKILFGNVFVIDKNASDYKKDIGQILFLQDWEFVWATSKNNGTSSSSVNPLE